MAGPTAIVYKVTMSGHFPPLSRRLEHTQGLPGLYLAHFLDALLHDAGQQRAVLAEAGIAPEALSGGQRVALAQVLKLVETIDSRARPGWHIRPSLDMEAAHHGPLGVAVISAATVADALHTLTRFEAVRAPFAHLQPSPAGGDWSMRIIATTVADSPWPVLMEVNLLALAGLIRRLLGSEAHRLRLRLPDGYRPWEWQLVAALPGQIEFGGEDYGLTVPGELLEQACRLADPRLHEDAVEHCRMQMAERLGTSPLEGEIRRRLLAGAGPPLSQAAMAEALNLSSRSLHRHLASHGRSYRQIVAEVRAAIAAHRLRHSRDPIARIAEDLGYQDTANFGRACRRWFGCSPGALRRRRN